MRISVFLTPEEYDVLVSQAAEFSPASRALSAAAILSHIEGDGIAQGYEVSSEDIELHALLVLAQNHCPSALRKMVAAIRESHLAESAGKRP